MGNWGARNDSATSKSLHPIFSCMGLLNEWREWFRGTGNFPWPNDPLGTVASFQASPSCMETEKCYMISPAALPSLKLSLLPCNFYMPRPGLGLYTKCPPFRNASAHDADFFQRDFIAPLSVGWQRNIAYLNAVSTEYKVLHFLAKLFCRVTCSTAAACSRSYVAAFQQYLEEKRLPALALHWALGFSQVAVIIPLYSDIISVF